MKIRIEDTAKIEEAITAAAGRASAMVPGAADAQRVARWAEDQLAAKGLPKADRHGASVVFTVEGPSRSYRYKSKTVTLRLARTSGGWFLAGASADAVYPGSREQKKLFVSEKQAKLIAAAATRDLYVRAA